VHYHLPSEGLEITLPNGPLTFHSRVTYSCNAHCKHCHLGGFIKGEELPLRTIWELCREIQPVVAQISGASRLIRKDLEQIYPAMKRPNRAPYIVVTTMDYADAKTI